MLLIHDFMIGLVEYETRGKSNDFPVYNECFVCKGRGKLHCHGFYLRSGVTEEEAVRIYICQLKCVHCKTTFSILPDLLIPYYQHTLHTIIQGIDHALVEKKKTDRRQLIGYHLKRYLKILKWIHSFFTNLGYNFGFSNDQKKKL